MPGSRMRLALLPSCPQTSESVLMSDADVTHLSDGMTRMQYSVDVELHRGSEVGYRKVSP